MFRSVAVAIVSLVGMTCGAEPMVAPRGSRVQLETGLSKDAEGFRAWRLAAYVSHVPAAFRERFADKIRENKSEPQFSTIELVPYTWTSEPPPVIEVDTKDWPVGDYRLTLHTILARDGKEIYPQKGLSFTLRETKKTAPIGQAGEIAFVAGFDGDPKGAVCVDVPWQENFSIAKSHTIPEARTKYKVFHDNDWLYFAVVAEEPSNLEVLRQMPKVGDGSYLISDHRRDALEVSVDPTGKGLSFYKIIVNPSGDMSDLRGEDDNTNTGTYVLDWRWRSHARTVISFGKKTWALEVAIPFGALDGIPSDPAAKWGVAVGRQRYAGEPVTPSYHEEFSISFPSVSLGEATAFPRFGLAGLQPKTHAWDVSSIKTSVAPTGDGLGLSVAATLFNRTGDYRDARLRIFAEDKDGKAVAEAEESIPVSADVLKALSVRLAPVPRGNATLRLEILGSGGILEKGVWTDAKVAYDPIKVTLTKPAYHDCVFDSMHLTSIEGVVTLEEGVGGPLDLSLTGPDTREILRIEKAQKSNRFSFPFRDKPKGDYSLRAGTVTKRIRNLPFKAGEVWLDETGVAYREGVKMLPFGFFSERYREMFPGLNIAQSYASKIADPAWVAWRCEEAYSNGCGFVFSPYQDFGDEKWENVFGKLAVQGEFGKGRLGEQQKMSLRRFAELVRDQRGFFAYYMDDEPEGRGVNPDFHAEARKILMEIDPYHPAIMVNYSVDGLRRYREGGDILCPDAYAVYYEDGGTMKPKRCSYDSPKAASECGVAWLAPAAFDWARPDGDRRPRGPTYAELREQCLLGLVADARGFMLYDRCEGQPGGYQVQLGAKFVLEELTEARDAFLAPSRFLKQTVDPVKTTVFAALKQAGDDTVVIVVNTERIRCHVELSGAGLPDTLYLGGVGREVKVGEGELVLDMEPYESRVYRSKPWKFSPARAQAAIDAAEAGRRKPGNLCVARHFRTWKGVLMSGEGTLVREGPHFTASSSHQLFRDLYYPYFLQDGIAQELPVVYYHGWCPKQDDKAPWIKCDFGSRKKFSRIVLTRTRDASGRFFLKSGTVEANGREIARFGDQSDAVVRLEFPPVEADSFTVRIVERDFDAQNPILSEIEAY